MGTILFLILFSVFVGGFFMSITWIILSVIIRFMYRGFGSFDPKEESWEEFLYQHIFLTWFIRLMGVAVGWISGILFFLSQSGILSFTPIGLEKAIY